MHKAKPSMNVLNQSSSKEATLKKPKRNCCFSLQALNSQKYVQYLLANDIEINNNILTLYDADIAFDEAYELDKELR